jgi:phosphate transport system substrate-binding protein
MILAVLAGSSGLALADVVRVGGTGAATELIRYLASDFADSDIKVEVIPSLGSSGALRALADSMIDIAVSGRPLSREEASKGLTQALAVQTPFGLATSHHSPNALSSSQVAEIVAHGKSRWADGSPIRVILRPRSDSDTPRLGSLFPGMSAAIEQARSRPDVPIAATDQDNANMAERVPTSLAGATLTQVRLEKRNLRFVPIDGVEPTLANFESGKYPYAKTMYFVLSAVPKAAVTRFIAYLKSPLGQRALRQADALLLAE